MARISFTQNLQRHVTAPTVTAPGDTLRAVLDAVFAEHPAVRGYVLDDQGAVRKHMAIFINGRQVADRTELSDAVGENDEIYVMQALSGG